MKNTLVYITDENYVMPTCVSVTSLLSHVNNITIYILCDRISPISKEYLEQLDKGANIVHLIEIDCNVFQDIKEDFTEEHTYVTRTSFFKFHLPNILENEDTVLYLDSDVIVNGDISEIFSLDLTNKYVASVDDIGDEGNKNGCSVLGKKLAGVQREHYFNSGVMYLNLAEMRNNNVSEKLIYYRTAYHNNFMDQDALNAVLGEKRIILPIKFNFLMSQFDLKTFDEVNNQLFDGKYHSMEECVNDQLILHLTGPYKAWKYYYYPSTNVFLKYYRQSSYNAKKINFLSPICFLSKQLIEWEKNYNRLLKKYKYIHKCKVNMDWHFPRERIPKGSKIILYGAGEIGKFFNYKLKENAYCDVVSWVDTNYMNMNDPNITSPNIITEISFDYILIAVSRDNIVNQIYESLLKLNVDAKKIIKLFSE